jgi:holo-[acyl-carrier protein] synthase
MAILGIGVDLADYELIGSVVERSGQRFLDRVYTPLEQACCRRRRDPVPCLTSRFAAKEALAKALQLGIAAMGLTDAEVRNRDNGAPYFELHGPLGRWAQRQAGLSIHLSLSDSSGHAVAMVVVEADNEAGAGGVLPMRL